MNSEESISTPLNPQIEFKGMDPAEILEFIYRSNTREDCCVSVTQNNSSTYYGYFDIFDDSTELMKENKWRFVPIHHFNEFFHDKRKSNKPNPVYSVIIEGSSISRLELLGGISRAS
jgi:hypothetical protein